MEQQIVDPEKLIPTLIFLAHLTPLIALWRRRDPLTPALWVLRADTLLAAALLSDTLLGDLQLGYQPEARIVIPWLIETGLFAASWARLPRSLIWWAFAVHFVLAAGILWFALFFRMDRLF